MFNITDNAGRMMNNLGNTNAVILRRPTNPDEINSAYVLALQKTSVNTATRLQTPKDRIAVHKLMNSDKVSKPQPKRLSYTAKNTACRMKKVINQQA